MTVAEAERVTVTEKGYEALTFVADGDMRQGLNTLQSCAAGFSVVDDVNVFKVADTPHPIAIKVCRFHVYLAGPLFLISVIRIC